MGSCWWHLKYYSFCIDIKNFQHNRLNHQCCSSDQKQMQLQEILCIPVSVLWLKAHLALFAHTHLNIENHTLLSRRYVCLLTVCTTLYRKKLSIHIIKNYSESPTEDKRALWRAWEAGMLWLLLCIAISLPSKSCCIFCIGCLHCLGCQSTNRCLTAWVDFNELPNLKYSDC